LTGGSFKEGESSAIGYKIATATAFRDACAKADPVLLEPIMKVNVITPSDFVGEVIGDVNVRRGLIEGIDNRGIICEIQAKIPLKEMFGYSTDLRSATQGRAVFSMHFFKYDRI